MKKEVMQEIEAMIEREVVRRVAARLARIDPLRVTAEPAIVPDWMAARGIAPFEGGDTEYDAAYSNAILEKLPVGFEVAWVTRSTWPIDRDGLTWVKIYCTDPHNVLALWKREAVGSRSELNRLREAIKKLL